MFMDKKSRYWQDVSSYQIDLYSKCNLRQNPHQVSCGYQQTDSNVYMDGQKIQSGQHDIEGEESVWKPTPPAFETTETETGLGRTIGQWDRNRSAWHSQRVIDKGAKAEGGSKDHLSDRGAGPAGHPRAK